MRQLSPYQALGLVGHAASELIAEGDTEETLQRIGGALIIAGMELLTTMYEDEPLHAYILINNVVREYLKEKTK